MTGGAHPVVKRLRLHLAEDARRRGEDARRRLAGRDMLRWLEAQRIRLEGRPLSFHEWPWLRGIYGDDAHHVVLRKAAQVGGSVWAILRVLHICDTLPGVRGVAYYFPTKTDVTDFSSARVAPLVDENPGLRRLMGKLDNVGVRQYGDAFVYFRGMLSGVQIKSIPVDAIVFDELDEAPPASKEAAVERMGASPHKYLFELSNPTLPGYGIDLAYRGNPELLMAGSDQRAWHIRCGACRYWTVMENEFPMSLGADDLVVLRPDAKYANWRDAARRGVPFEEMGWRRVCAKCGREIDPRDGKWVALNPSVQSPHGYSISQLTSPFVPPHEIAKAYATTRHPQKFYNLKIGVGWLQEEDRLTVADVLRWCTDAGMESSHEGPCTMGVDVGAVFHVKISCPGPHEMSRRTVWLGTVKEWEDLDRLMEAYHVERCVIDALPEQRGARAFARRHPGRVYCCYYSEQQMSAPVWRKEDATVIVNRTESLDASRAPFTRDPTSVPRYGEHREYLPRPFDVVEEFARHVAAMLKQKSEDEKSGKVKVSYVRVGPDHFAHAHNYDFLCYGFELWSTTRPRGRAGFGAVGQRRWDGRAGREGVDSAPRSVLLPSGVLIK